jgi:hypothetical protein
MKCRATGVIVETSTMASEWKPEMLKSFLSDMKAARSVPPDARRHWIWLPFALIPAMTVFPIGSVFLQLALLGHSVPNYLEVSLWCGLGAALLILAFLVNTIERLQHRIGQLEGDVALMRSQSPKDAV